MHIAHMHVRMDGQLDNLMTPAHVDGGAITLFPLPLSQRLSN